MFYDLLQGVTAGPTQGFGAAFRKSVEKTPLASGPTDVATGAFNLITGAGETLQTLNGTAGLASAGITGAEFASGVGAAKLICDFGSYSFGLVACAGGPRSQ